MGAGNVTRVLTNWSSRLNDRPFRALVQMALLSKDKDEPPRYWAGWALLAEACGSPVPTACVKGCRSCPECAPQRRVAARAVASLTASGAITLLEKAGLGKQACYALHLDPPSSAPVHRYGTKAPQKAPPCVTPSVIQPSDAERHTTDDAERRALHDAERHTEEEFIPSTGTQPGTNSSQVSTSPALVDDEQPCPRCRWMAWEGHAPGCVEARSPSRARRPAPHPA